MNFKLIFFVVLFTITSILTSYSQELTSSGTKYTVIAKLKKDYENDCNCQSLVVKNKMFDFRVIEINMDDYFLDDINIIIPCPESYGESFLTKGTVYKIEFYDNCIDMNSDEGVCDYDIPKRKKMRRRFWVHSIIQIDK